MIGRCAWTGSGWWRRWSNVVVAARRRRDLLAVEQIARIAPTDSSSQSSRWPKPDPKSMPWALCSCSIHAPPMPRIARPSLTWSSVAAIFADEARVAERVGPDEQPEPRPLGRHAAAARARPALEDRLVRVAEDRVEVVPRPEVVVAEPVDALGGVEHLGQSVAWFQSRMPSFVRSSGPHGRHGRSQSSRRRLADGSRSLPESGSVARSCSIGIAVVGVGDRRRARPSRLRLPQRARRRVAGDERRPGHRLVGRRQVPASRASAAAPRRSRRSGGRARAPARRDRASRRPASTATRRGRG